MPSGSWSCVVKPSKTAKYPDLRELIADDDWVDISFIRHGKKWHVMRGMVDEVRRLKGVGGSGATTTQYLVTGRDFGRVWEGTPVWFNRYRAENAGGGISIRIFGGVNFTGSVSDTVKGILWGFIAQLGAIGRNLWEPPSGVPNTVGGSFVDSVVFDESQFSSDPPRFAIAPQLMDPQGQGCWELAKEWSDPMFCELWCDLVDTTGPFSTAKEIAIGDAAMGVVLRDVPYPTLALGMESPWFRLPTFVIPRQAVIDQNIGKSGFERYNAFFVGPQVLQGFGIQQQLDITAPLWDLEDMKVHGMRRFDVDTHYCADEADLITLTKHQREKIRDWYAINPYLYNGTLSLGRGFPEIRIGSRIRIPGVKGPEDQETFYVESVGHTWTFGPGARTNLGVTRGWIGSDSNYLEKLAKIAKRYTADERSLPNEFGTSFDDGKLYA
jgi:hypothetical protein